MKEPDTYILLATVIDICMYQSEFFFFERVGLQK